MGKGYFSSIIPNNTMRVNICDISFNNSISFNEIAKVNCFLLSFCILECFEWENIDTNEELFLGTNEYFIHGSYEFITRNHMQAGERYLGLSVGIDERKFENIINDYFNSTFISDFSKGILNRIDLSRKGKLILRDILTCTYIGNIKNIYIEGKILELLSVMANDLKENNRDKVEEIISRGDLDSINRIRDIIDKNYVNPLSIDQLAKLGFISQTKLKNNFKKVFGKTIYEYVIDRRMEKAKEFLDDSKIKVKEAAGMVGYSNIGHFSKNFKAKYGFSPREYLKFETK